MNSSNKTVSQEAMQAEWLEVQAAQQNPAHFRPLYDRYFEPIFRFVFKRCADENLAGDICSQVFLKAMQKLGSYQYKGVPFSAWLYRIASNEVAQHFRNTQKNRVVSVEDHSISDLIDEIADDGDFEKARQQLLQTLNQLKPKDLTLIELRFFEGRPFKEIADILEITESNAKVKTYRILEKMKKIMKI
ncbi:MAG: sigma-70 family RNA polymerase sigma factor [Bacteroidota bacterium]